MAAWGSDLSLILRTSGVLSRRIAEFTPTYGSIRHRFAFKCPGCKRRLPRSSALREEEARSLEIDWSSVDLFFFDRANSAGIYLANLAREAGATVMFEPPKSQADTRLYDAAAVADIVKYSAQDFKDSLPTEVTSQLKLLIETQDGKGLRYRHRQGAALGDWRSVPAFDAVQPRDAAGAGDWCTAGFIKEMVEHKKTWSWTSPELESALAYGQALAAISVCFLGPLGALLALPGEDLTFCRAGGASKRIGSRVGSVTKGRRPSFWTGVATRFTTNTRDLRSVLVGTFGGMICDHATLAKERPHGPGADSNRNGAVCSDRG